jgi:hypothetical protein
MSNDNNSGIRVNIHNHEENKYDYVSQMIIMVERPYNPFHQPVFNGNGMNPEDEIRNALDQVSMLNVMGAFFDNFLGMDPVGMSDERMMEIARRESLAHYKTQEKKPHIKLGIASKIADESMKNESCTICVSKFDVGENITELECKHTLHTDCIAEWVKYKSECPVCRQDIQTIDKTPDLSSDEDDLVPENELDDPNELN